MGSRFFSSWQASLLHIALVAYRPYCARLGYGLYTSKTNGNGCKNLKMSVLRPARAFFKIDFALPPILGLYKAGIFDALFLIGCHFPHHQGIVLVVSFRKLNMPKYSPFPDKQPSLYFHARNVMKAL
jgi:hypothetical protein